MPVDNHNTTQQSTTSATANHLYPHYLHCLFTAVRRPNSDALNTRILVPGIPAFTEVAAFNNESNQWHIYDSVNAKSGENRDTECIDGETSCPLHRKLW